MAFSLINIGFGNMAAANRIMAIISPESAPVKRIVQESRDRGQLIDATYACSTYYGYRADHSVCCTA